MPDSASRQTGILAGALLILCLPLLLWQGSAVNQMEIPLGVFLSVHSMLEIASIAISSLIFFIAFGTRDIERSIRVVLLGCFFLATAVLDTVHTLSYAGMPDLVSPNTPDKMIWFWLAARISAGLGLLAYALWPQARPVSSAGRRAMLAGTLAGLALILYVILFHESRLPDMYVAGKGLTPLKVSLEWGICGLYLLAAGLIYRRRNDTANFDARRLVLALLIMAAGELFFTVYVQVSSTANLLGHVYKVVAYGVLYQAIFAEAIRQPFVQIRQLNREVVRERDFAASLVDTAPVIILLLDARGRIQHANPFFEQLTGYRLDEIQGKDWFSTFLPARDQDRIRALFNQSIHELATRGNVNPIVIRSGEEREIEWNDQTLRDADGTITGLLATGLDVTGKRQLEQALRKAYGENQAVTQAIHDNLYMMDESGQLVWWNRQVEAVTGLSPASLEGMPVLEFFVPEDRAAVEQALGKAFADGYGEVEARKITRDGPVWYQYNGVRVQDAQGHVIGIAGVGRDISERLQALEALQRSERELKALNESLEARVLERTAEVQQHSLRHEAIVRTATDGFFSADLAGRLRDVNPAFCTQLGYSEAELLRMSIADFEASENPADVAVHAEKIFAQGQDRFDTRHRRKDGSLVEVEVSVSLAEIGGEKIFFAFTRDITPRKALQAALVRARDEAERANAAKSEFLSRMSHELRTPLNAILGFGQLLETDPTHPLTAGQIDNAREIRHAGEHLLQMVNEVLDLSRIESGRLELSLEPVWVASVIKACLAQIQPLAAQRGISLVLEQAVSCKVLADPVRLKGVLLNLLANAVKYNREGGSIQVGCVAAGADRLRISVRDSGRGIAADALPRLFKPFERMESAYDGIEGTGIGLALAKKLVEGMHGDIGVETVQGEGSTFWFELPLAGEGAAIAEPAVPLATPDAASAGNRKTLLCIEDNPANLRLVHKIIATRKNIDLLDAVTAEAGLEVAARQGPDLILLDINLPGMDGFEALRRLRDNPATRDIPVVALTANAMRSDIERGEAAGFSAYLTKPIHVAEFLGMIDRCLPDCTENTA
jgi:PAS domain S-box-containing protein